MRSTEYRDMQRVVEHWEGHQYRLDMQTCRLQRPLPAECLLVVACRTFPVATITERPIRLLHVAKIDAQRWFIPASFRY